jgi:ubiquinone biosynthesis protein
MWAFIRLIRATLAFGLIALDYLIQLGLSRLFPRSARIERRWERLHDRNARRLYRGCVRLRGVYIKMGQVLSVMGSFLPAAFQRELEGLQDAVPPQPWRVIRRALAQALGEDFLRHFKTFQETPVAAASLGQVHAAETVEGQRVAVKVLYPNVKTIIRVDLRVLGWAMQLYKLFVPMQQLDRVLVQLRAMLARETDLTQEARALGRMAADFADEPTVALPPVVPALSTATVLTMGFMDGVKISDRAGLAALGCDPHAVGEILVKAFYRAIFVHRFFHADPHPGNFLVTRGDDGAPRLVILDLGSAAELDDRLAGGITHLLAGFMSRNDAMIVAGMERIGFVAPDGDRALLQRTVSTYFRKLAELNLSDLSQVDFRTAERFIDPDLKRRELRSLMRALAYPEGWFEVERTAIMLFALSANLAPKLNTIEVGFPWVMRFLAKNPLPMAPRPTVATPSREGLPAEAGAADRVDVTPLAALAEPAPVGQALGS